MPGTFTAHGCPDKNDGKPSAGTLIPGNIKSAPPMTNRETSPPFSIKHGRSSGTFHRAKTAQRKSKPSKPGEIFNKKQNIKGEQNKFPLSQISSKYSTIEILLDNLHSHLGKAKPK